MTDINLADVLEVLRPYTTQVHEEIEYMHVSSLDGKTRSIRSGSGHVRIELRVPRHMFLSYVSPQEIIELHNRMLTWLLLQLDIQKRAQLSQLRLGDVVADEDLSMQLAAIEERFYEFERAHARLTGKQKG